MYKLDEQERLIIRELIRDPRISDNQIAIKTSVPLKTVNRKRKLLEEKNLLSYYCDLNTTRSGTGSFLGRSIFVIVLRDGLTRKEVMEKFETSQKTAKFFPKHVESTRVGEYEGNVCLVMFLVSIKQDDIIEIYNADIVSELEASFGKHSVKKTMTIPLASTLRKLRNYLPEKNMAQGKIKDSWPNDNIFIDD